jgi:polyferredoxin
MPPVPLPLYPSPAAPGTDVLRWPLVGRFLRWRHARTALQCGLLAVAAAVVAHGLLGPQFAPRNLATVLTWVHYRGLLLVALLAAGNLFCTGCPFVLVRDAARRWRRPRRRWPVRLRGKWIGLGLIALFLFLYELLDLWATPRGTAALVLAYFAAALAIDLVFSGASFCKHLCPIGQYNFIASTVSPLDLQVKDVETCASGCRTRDCIRGVRDPEDRGRVLQRGCELGLFLPAKVGTLDCTLCLDCVHACPHDNIALTTRLPASELWDARRRSGVGRLAARPDLAALAVVFTFAALLNAAGMVGPFQALQAGLAAAMGARSEAPVLALLFLAGLVAVPAGLVALCATATSRLSGRTRTVKEDAVAYAYALVPLGFSVWAAHYGFHLLTGVLTVVPVAQAAVADLFGRELLGRPLWGWAGLQPGALFPVGVGLVLLGALFSVATAGAISQRDHPASPLRAAAPWVGLIAALAATAIWILSLPMEMRAAFQG